MTPAEFIQKWRATELKERSASQEHFLDLCELLEIEKPASADPKGEWFTFEKGASKTGGGEGWADVWRKECFAWEYKGKKKDLDRAFAQLQQYAIALDNPPLLIVSDMDRFRIHTNWTNTVQEVREFTLDDLLDGATRDLLRACFLDPERLKPAKTRQMLTEEAAEEFSQLAQRLRARGHDPHSVAHFVNRLVFCMFAEDVGLLPKQMFQRMLELNRNDPASFVDDAASLFAAMKSGGKVGFEKVEWFNGGLFDDESVLPLERDDIENLITAAKMFWDEIDPSILGTLFERGLDPDKRSQLGAHYTDRDKIMQIIEPVIIRPLLSEWEAIRSEIEARLLPAEDAAQILLADAGQQTELSEEVKELQSSLRDKPQGELFADMARQKRVRKLDAIRAELRSASRDLRDARDFAKLRRDQFVERLRNFRVLDPACGSGNFLYLSLLALKDIEHRVNIEAEVLGVERASPTVGPECVLGIEINPYAAELARVSVWIGEIQWMRRNGFEAARNPILRSLGNIECRDAILASDGTEAQWPLSTVIVGNPPFLGAKLMKRLLGIDETQKIRAAFDGRLPGFTDLACYWFEKAREKIAEGHCKRAGLVATNSIRKNTNLPVMKRIVETTKIFDSWSEQKWTIEGAAVDVSLVCFGDSDQATRLDGQIVSAINPDLTTGLNLTLAAALHENRGGAYLGIQKSGPFDIPGETARLWMAEPTNPNGLHNSAVLKPYWNGDDVTGRPRDYWLIDLPLGLNEADAAVFASPFEHIRITPDESGKTIAELRAELGDRAGPRWWEPHWPRPEMRSKISEISRYIVTPETAQYRLFAWLQLPVLPDKNLIVIPRDDNTSFGVLQSRFHELWALRKGSDLQDRPRYTHTSVFATFPFPEGLTPDIPAAEYADDPRAQAIAAAAERLNTLRENWLNPPDLVERVPEVVPGYPDRILPKDEAAAQELKKRTLTNLYNARPAWLDHAHRALDEAVADAYGWGEDYRAGTLTDDEILARLFLLNQERAKG